MPLKEENQAGAFGIPESMPPAGGGSFRESLHAPGGSFKEKYVRTGSFFPETGKKNPQLFDKL